MSSSHGVCPSVGNQNKVKLSLSLCCTQCKYICYTTAGGRLSSCRVTWGPTTGTEPIVKLVSAPELHNPPPLAPLTPTHRSGLHRLARCPCGPSVLTPATIRHLNVFVSPYYINKHFLTCLKAVVTGWICRRCRENMLCLKTRGSIILKI